MHAIEVKDLCKRFPGFALNKVSFFLPSGCIHGLVGGKQRGQEHAH